MDENIEKKSNRQILSGSAMAYLSLAVNIVAGMIYTPWMIRQIGQSQYGLYTLAVSLISILMFDFGIGTALSRFGAQYRAKNDVEGMARFYGLVNRLYLAIDGLALLVASILFFFLGSIYNSLTANELASFRVVYVMVVGYNLFAFAYTPLNGMLNACEEFVALKFSELLTRVLTIILVVVALTRGGGLYSLVAANIVSGAAAILFKLWVVRHRLNLRPQRDRLDLNMLRELLSFSVWTAVMGVASTLSTGLMPSIVAIGRGSLETAIYGAATTLNGYAYLLTAAIGGMFLPKVMRLFERENAPQALTALAIKVGRLLMMLASLILAGFFLIGKEFFVLWMGSEYAPAYGVACALLVAELLAAPQTVFSTAMTARGFLKPIAISNLIFSAGILVAGCAVTRAMGAFGCGMVICIGYLLRELARMIFYKKYLSIDLSQYIKRIYGPMAIYFPSMLVAFLLLRGFTALNWGRLVAKGAIVCVAYLLVSVVFVMNWQERAVVTAILKKIWAKFKGLRRRNDI
ncbi:oligosaccharide flippase family protein [Candidatus Allofournierella excrementigallinarum]|uniref:oligosaccharide flippase family protein n=1 Tax=Candidatus Allofournierella excrementigallinarum TaxID=2838592 RepID=UPI00374FC51A